MASVKNFNEQLLVPPTSSNKSHKIIQLPNGLLVLLISDPAEDLSSIALAVAAGAHNDPDDIPGLAHFCEHLLLLGSKNYPNPNEFHDFLSKNGGRRNAFTTGEKTCYFFEIPSTSTHKVGSIDEPIFNHLIEIFADCFKNPIFNESMFEKEIYAIDNEHTANKSSSGRIMYHGTRLISSEAHPFHRFATGNFFTLSDLPKVKKLKVRSKLLDYYKDNYHADKMSLVIRSSQSLNILTKLVVQNFSDLPTTSTNTEKKSKLRLFNNNKSTTSQKEPENSYDVHKTLNDFNILSNWHYDAPPFSLQESNNCILINSPNNPTIRLIFPYQDSLSPNTDLLVSAWCNIVGDESKGSLDQYLKSKGFSLALSAFSQNLSVGNSILIVEIKLTNTGIKNLKIIVALLLSRYKSEVFQDVHELARVLFELESIDILNYLHQDTNKSPMDEASRYAQTFLTNLKSLKPKNLLKGSNNWDSMHNLGSVKGDLFWPGKGEAFFKFINDVFNLDNLKLVVLGDLKVLSTVMSDVSVDGSSRSDQFFNFDYKVGKFKPESFSSSIIQENSFKFEIIPRNPFIPKYALDHSNLQKLLLESTEQSSLASLSFVTKSIWSSTIAKLTKKEQNYEIWTKLEPSKIFNSKLFISFDIVLLDIESNPENTMMTEIITELLKFKISSMLYASELVNYTWEIQASLKGDVRFGFTVSGYSEGIDHLINIIIDEFLQLYEDPVSVDEFRKSRVAVRSRYKELEQNNSLSMAISGLLVVLEENMWTLEDRLDSLDDIDIDSLKNFLQSFFKDNDKYTKIFIHGDIQDTESISKSINKLSNHLNSKENKVLSFEEPSTHSISPGKAYNIKRKGAKGDPMNSISFFIETGPRGDYKTRQITRLLSYLMSLTLVPDLRFKKQLGYAVLGGTRILRSTYGIHISIMSGTFTPQYLEDKINEYLLSWEKTYINMTDKEFQTTVIEPFLKNFKIDLTKSGGPESLTAEMPSSVSCSNVANAGESMRIHKWIRDLISAKSYQGAESNEDEDSEFFNSLTRLEFLKFFQSRVSSKFKTRSQLSVMIKSQLSTEETQQQLIQLQLEAFLKMNGLRISSEQLKQIVGSAKGNPVFLLKDLFKYFMSQGESFKLCAIVLKEAVKQVFEGVKHYKSNYSETSNHNDGEGVKSGDITDIREFQKQNPVYHIK